MSHCPRRRRGQAARGVHCRPARRRSPSSSAHVAPELLPSRRRAAARGQPRGAARHHDRRARRSPAAWSWPATAARRWATSSPTATWRRSSRPTSTPPSASPAPPGIAIELVKLFQVELEHYEKIEGTLLSVEGKANRLAIMIRGQPRPWPCRASSVVPLFAGYDVDRRQRPDLLLRRDRRLLQEHDHHSVGSGSLFARGSMKKLWRPGLDADEAVGSRRGALRRRRRRLGHRRPRPGAADLADGRRRRPSRACGSCPSESLRAVVERRSIAGTPGQPGRCAMRACRSTSRPSS